MSMRTRAVTETEFYRNPNRTKLEKAAKSKESIQNKEDGGWKSKVILGMAEAAKAASEGKLTADGVTLELSDEAREAIGQAGEKAHKDQEEVNMLNALKHDAVVASQQADAMEEVAAEEAKALEIARRISKGGRVPPQDEKLLLDVNPDLYKMAKLSAMNAKKHKKYDTLVEEKKEKEEYDYEEGQDHTLHRVGVEVSAGDAETGEGAEVLSVSEVAVTQE